MIMCDVVLWRMIWIFRPVNDYEDLSDESELVGDGEQVAESDVSDSDRESDNEDGDF